MITPAQYNIKMSQGSQFVLPFSWKDGSGNVINVTDPTTIVRFVMKETFTSRNAVLDLAVRSGITVSATAPAITVTATGAQTSAITPGQYMYWVYVKIGTDPETVLTGDCYVSPGGV
jgi:hypothetical protein